MMNLLNYQLTGFSIPCSEQETNSASISAATSSFLSNNFITPNDTIHIHAKEIAFWGAMTSIILAKGYDNDEEDDDFQDPDPDELLRDMFPDEDDDFWNDNYDID